MMPLLIFLWMLCFAVTAVILILKQPGAFEDDLIRSLACLFIWPIVALVLFANYLKSLGKPDGR